MQFLFLFATVGEYRKVLKTIKQEMLADYTILHINTKAPYFNDNTTTYKYVSRWEDFLISDTLIDFFWIENLRSIEKIALNSVAKVGKTQLVTNPYYLLGLIKKVGNDYLKYVHIFDQLLKSYKPAKIFINKKNVFIVNAILSIAQQQSVTVQSIN